MGERRMEREGGEEMARGDRANIEDGREEKR